MSHLVRVSVAVLLVGSLVSGSAFAADPTALLDKAESAMRDLEYGEALKHIEAARKEPNNSRAVMVRLLELQSVALATMGQEAKALKAFQALLSLNPDFKLSGKQPPRVSTVFFEARGWIDQNKPLTVRAGTPTYGPGVVKELKVEVPSDPAKLLKKVRLFTVIDGKQKSVDLPVAATVSTKVDAARVEWWAEALGEKDAVFATIGDSKQPQRAEAPDAPVAAKQPTETPDIPIKPKPPPEPETKPEPKDDPGISAWAEPPPPSKPIKPLRLVSFALGGAAVVAAGVGVGFGVAANGSAMRIATAERDASGRITSLTRADALTIDAQQRTQASLANVMFVASGALLGTGVVLFFLGGGSDDAPAVTVSPALGGAVLSGHF